jgi:hypothetical protein
MGAFDNIITPAFKQLHADAITEVVRANAVDCTVISGGTLFTDCPNCIYDGAANKSSGRFQAGGSQVFTGICPICLGSGKLKSEQSASVSLAVIYNHKDWIIMAPNINNPNGYVQTIGLAALVNQLKKAKELIVNTDISDDYSIRQRMSGLENPNFVDLGRQQ